MGHWDQPIKEHSVWNSIEEAKRRIELARNQENLDSMAMEGVARIGAVVDAFSERVSACDQKYIILTDLNESSSLLSSLSSSIQSFLDTKDSSHIINADGYINSIIHLISRFYVPNSPQEITAASKSATEYNNAVVKWMIELSSKAGQLKNDIETLGQRLSELSSFITSERQNLSALASDHQSQFSNAQDTRGREWQEAVAARSAAFSDLLGDMTTKISNKETEYSQVILDIKRLHDSDLADVRSAYDEKLADLVDYIAEQKNYVESLVGIIGSLGISSGYDGAAREARNTSRIWQGVAVAAMIAWITISILAILPSLHEEFVIGSFLGRLFISLTAGVLAAYAAQQADKYQKAEARSRKLALELAALGPFTAPLEKAKQEEFRMKIGDLSFGRSELLVHEDKISPDVLALLKDKSIHGKFLEFLKSLMPK